MGRESRGVLSYLQEKNIVTQACLTRQTVIWLNVCASCWTIKSSSPFRNGKGLIRPYSEGGGVLYTVWSPAAVFLVAWGDAGLKTGGVALCCLYRPDQLGFFHFAGLDPHLLCNHLDFFYGHEAILPLLHLQKKVIAGGVIILRMCNFRFDIFLCQYI